MSDLQRSFAKAKLSGLPPQLPGFAEEDEATEEPSDQFPYHRDVSDDSSSASSASSTGTIRPSISSSLFARPTGFVISLLDSQDPANESKDLLLKKDHLIQYHGQHTSSVSSFSRVSPVPGLSSLNTSISHLLLAPCHSLFVIMALARLVFPSPS